MNLDKRIIDLYDLKDEKYTAKQFCSILFENKENIFKVWFEEDNSITDRRYALFVEGANKFLNKTI